MKTIQQDQDSGGRLQTNEAKTFSKHLYESIIVRGVMGAVDQDAQVNASPNAGSV